MSGEPETTGRKQDGTFAPGHSGNPSGRPKGARHKLSERFLEALLADFERAADEADATLGAVAIEAMRKERPHEYARMIASLLTKELDANLSGDISEELKRWLGIG
jgi:hypothetical protein